MEEFRETIAHESSVARQRRPADISDAKQIMQHVEDIQTANTIDDLKQSSCELAGLWMEMSPTDRNVAWKELRQDYVNLTPLKILVSPEPRESLRRFMSPKVQPIFDVDSHDVRALSFESTALSDLKLHNEVRSKAYLEVWENGVGNEKGPVDVRGNMKSKDVIETQCVHY